jgi:hypothetical protein
LDAESADRQREQARIAALLDTVERSGAAFIREERTYSAAEGRKHLERKLHHAGDRVTTAEQFIEEIASRSSTTGRPYFVKLPSGEQVETGPWLRQRLAEIDSPVAPPPRSPPPPGGSRPAAGPPVHARAALLQP